MLIHLRYLIVPLSVLIAFVVALWAIGQSEHFHNCIDNAQYKAAQETKQKKLSDVPITLLMRERCWGDYVDRYGNGIIAVFTIVLAGSTIGLWFVTNRTLAHAENTAKKQLRAYISVSADCVDRYNPDRPLAPSGQQLTGFFWVRNVGNIPAKNVSIFSTIEWAKAGDRAIFKPKPVAESKTVLQPRGEMRFGSQHRLNIDEIEGGFGEWKGYIYVWGVVTYTDEFGTNGWTNFCHRYNCAAAKPENVAINLTTSIARYHETGGNEAS
jgi:hypothetical protein